jgi:hypothetical protein
MFGNWLNGVEQHIKARIRLGVCALVWALWKCRNDTVFNKIGTAHFFQVIRMATHWTREWSYLPPEAQRAPMDSGCIRLEMVARAIYNQGGWRLFKRLHDAWVDFLFITLVDVHLMWPMSCKTKPLNLWIIK